MITSITYECTHFLIFLSISPCPAALLTFNEDYPPTGLVLSARPFPLRLCCQIPIIAASSRLESPLLHDSSSSLKSWLDKRLMRAGDLNPRPPAPKSNAKTTRPRGPRYLVDLNIGDLNNRNICIPYFYLSSIQMPSPYNSYQAAEWSVIPTTIWKASKKCLLFEWCSEL